MWSFKYSCNLLFDYDKSRIMGATHVKFQTNTEYILRIIKVILFADQTILRKFKFLSNTYKEHVRNLYVSTKFFT